MTRKDNLHNFIWSRDADGYDFDAHGRLIVRRRGALLTYRPDRWLYRDFADLFVADFHPDGGGVKMVPLSERPTKLLEFVSEFGFLGSDTWRADAGNEPLDYMLKAQAALAAFVHVGSAWGGAVLRQGPIAGPNVRLHLDAEGVHYQPESLYSWMWLHAATDLESGVRWDGPPCLYCGRPLGRGGNGLRADALYCNDTCRAAFNRTTSDRAEKRQRAARKEEARRALRKLMTGGRA